MKKEESLREELLRIEEMERTDNPEMPPLGCDKNYCINNVKWEGKSYQFIVTSDGTYSGQAIYYRRKGARNFSLIEKNIRLPEDYIFVCLTAFEKNGMDGLLYSLGL